ncbi:MAG TPA: hypothetical protein VFB45_10630 [Pseudolabrys sp.]|nr:hypothetical protein [Pseudolabrys sp.]
MHVIWKTPATAIAAALILAPGTANAGGPPRELYGKSVTISFSVSVDYQYTDGTGGHTVVQNNRTWYISDTGKVFRRVARTIAARRGANPVYEAGASRVGGNVIKTPNQYYAAVLNFNGHTATDDVKVESGARRLTVTFNDSFTGCSVSVVHGKEGGASGMVMRSMGGRMITVRNISAGSTSCSVAAGNMFSGGD